MVEQEVMEIRSRISQLNDLSGTDLKHEMDDLKMVLLKNPAACELLLPEDIGEMVKAIRHILGYAQIVAVPEKTTRSKRKETVDLTLDLSLE
jgi:hypothetical protein